MRPPLLILALVSLLAAPTACSSGPRDEGPAPVAKGTKVVFVSLGGDETAGADLDFPAVVRARWSQLVFDDSLPTRTVHVNAAAPERGIEDGAGGQLALAAEAGPTIATVWFGPGDDRAGTPLAVFASDLTAIVRRLTALHARVLVATGTGTRYDEVIDRVVADEKATPVDVSGLPTPLGEAGHRDAATRFARAIGKVP